LAAGFSAALCMVLVAGCGGVEPVAVQGDEPPVTTAVVQVEPTATTTTAVVQVEPTATTTTVVVQVERPTTTTAVVQVERPTTTTTTAVAPVEEPAGESPGPWMVNSTGRVAVVIHDDAPIPVNVQSVETVEVDGRLYQRVVATGMPDYVHVVTVADGAFLRERPRPGNDFTSGEPTVVVGDVLQFGSDLGYRSTGCSRAAGTGYGFWPPGPACPTRQARTVDLPLEPVEAAAPVVTGLGSIGLWVNGTAVFGWGDGQSWQDQRIWANLAPAAEAYDMDLCPGHSAMGNYHHHSHPVCLADQLDDAGMTHSPIYGFAIDGVAIAGPWVDDGLLARSSWKVRDYEDPGSSTGCGSAGERTCLLVDQMDVARGTVPTDAIGPRTDAVVQSQSGNTFVARAGWFMQDWFFDGSLDDGTPEALDEHNGHLGPLPGVTEQTYHYHTTRRTGPGGVVVDAFPYVVGPTYHGEVSAVGPVPGGGPGAGGPGAGGPGAGGPADLAAVAEALGVTLDALRQALGPPPPDIDGAAAALGVDPRDLRRLMGPAVGP
jgi:hypothetical protein